MTGEPNGPGYLPDSAPVVRGGSDTGTKSNPGGNSPEGIAKNTGTVPPNYSGAGLTGFSANSAPGTTAAQIGAQVKQSSYGATTAGSIRSVGGDPVPTPRPNNPTHITVTGLPPKTASHLFTPTVKKNP